MLKGKYDNRAYIFIAPAFILYVLFVFYPIVFNLYTSFYEWDGINNPTVFVGFRNYLDFFSDDIFGTIIRNTLLFGVIVMFFRAFFGLVSAVLIKRVTVFKSVFSSVVFLPVVMTPTVIGIVFENIFEPNYGPVNTILRFIGLDSLAQPWLAQPWSALLVIFLVEIWLWTGFFTVFYTAGMTSIPAELYEAADIDGASELRKFFAITFPMLRSTHFSLAILSSVAVLKVFDVVWILTRGGPANTTEFFATYVIKKSFIEYDQATSSAVSIVLFIIALVITVIQLKMYNPQNKMRVRS